MRHRKRRVGQFSLRTFLVVITVWAVVLAAYAKRQFEERLLVSLVVRYNAALDDARFADAAAIARETAEQFPNHDIAKWLVEQQQLIQYAKSGKVSTGGTTCLMLP